MERRDPTTAGWDELDAAEDGDLGADELLWACGTGSPPRGSRTRSGARLQSRGTRNAARGRGLAKRDEGVWELYFLSWALDGLL